MAETPVIYWFRQDLRLADNPALSAAIETGLPVICLFILEEDTGKPELGGASAWWLNKSLQSLRSSLHNLGGDLNLRRGDPQKILAELAESANAKQVFWNRRYDPASIKTDKAIKSSLTNKGIEVHSFNGNLLTEPWVLKTGSGGPYKVFTPFWKALSASYECPPATKTPNFKSPNIDSEELSDWGLHPTRPDWSSGLEENWIPGEDGAEARLQNFLADHLIGYDELRNRPDKTGTSRLSPHLAFGEIAPSTIWRITRSHIDKTPQAEADGWSFLREVGWRDFAYSLLYHAEDLRSKNWNEKFNAFPWQRDDEHLLAWQKGQTGYPIVDAGMRELWHTGWMHNRVRMIVGSFLVKHLRIDWREGEAWFWDTLVDADYANNPASWQWIAGSGADAAPYFRVFNPMTQGSKFDPDGEYVRRWVPEISALPTKNLHEPWSAPDFVLKKANIKLGIDYPKPIVDHKTAREKALAAYEETKGSR